jgi:hypothetical protein
MEIPVNFDDSKPFSPDEASLGLYRNDTIIQNMFERIQLQKDECGHFHMLSLAGLEAGKYILKTRFCSNEFQKLTI